MEKKKSTLLQIKKNILVKDFC